MTRPTAGELAAGAAVLAAAGAVVARPPVTGTGAAWTAGALVLGAAGLVGAAVVRRLGGARGPAAGMTVTGAALLVLAVLESAVDHDPGLRGVELRVLAAVLALLVPGLVITFPTGRLEHLTDRVAAGVVAACGLAVVVAPVEPVALPAGVLLCTAVVGAVWARFERSRDLDRERILWVLLGVGTVVVVGGHLLFAAEQFAGSAVETALLTVVLLCGLGIPAALVVALVAPRVTDVRRAISGVAVVIVMVDLALGVFAGTLATLEAITGRPPPRAVASVVCVVVAAGFHPALVRVRETLDQVLFGGRPDPVGVVSSLGDEFRRGGGPQQWLDALRASVDLPWAALHHDDEVVATSGRPVEPVTTIALHAGDEHVGDLVVGLPEHHRELPRATDAVLRLVAGPLARALQSARLAAQLQESRRLVVLAAEEERRRLRRDLHDGLGPVLAGVGYTADAARNVLDARPERSAELLATLREDVGGAIAEVRRLVHDLRPPVLDQLGLVAAVRQQAERVTQDGAGPAVTVEAGAVGTLPAAVEVAAYRVVSEAVLNVVRHAGARHARVTVRREDATLELLVADDGCRDAAWTPGVGLTSMRERLAQLGGTLEAGATPDGGRVLARLPLVGPP
ncbi:sensor histidine kinase [Actinomycetospora lutea]|uniref:sensor histidine kinase n=1 Tax=Actinomycetospora lutea TaxID=663604 RepID=UPI00236646D4|nr:sensor histidine kinase [Actinomycetospora lutea]MDD7939245.1 sensor histidine kinase [Actinomycetospora lutea]